jgi:DnaJ-class molecular chaperone
MAKAEIRVNLDARCSRCGAKGVAQNGLCLQCTGDDIIKKIDKEASNV